MIALCWIPAGNESSICQDPNAAYPASCFQRHDPTDDILFYSDPRMVLHIDDGAIVALGTIYGELLPTSGRLFDPISSWRTHLPEAVAAAAGFQVVGLGKNAEEMAGNPLLAWRLVHDLNRDPRLSFDDAVFEGAMCSVSVRYVTRPIELFADVARVLKPGEPFIVSFSNRCFTTTMVAFLQGLTDEQHVQIVGSYSNQAETRMAP